MQQIGLNYQLQHYIHIRIYIQRQLCKYISECDIRGYVHVIDTYKVLHMFCGVEKDHTIYI